MKRPGSIVIVGGGLSGYTLADALRAHGFEGKLTVIDREPHLYDRPPLSKRAFVGGAPIEDLAFASAEELRQKNVESITGREVVSLKGGALLDDGTLVSADVLVLATGGRPRIPFFDGYDAPIVHTLRTFADARRIRHAAQPGAMILVVGAGLVGAELTSSLLAVGSRVTLVDPVELPLLPVVGEDIARYLHGMHAAHGVDVRIGTISGLTHHGQEWRAQLSDGSVFPVDAVVVGAGLIPNVELAEAAGLPVDNGVIVDEGFRVTDGIYAIGDVARVKTADGDLCRRQEHWEAAQKDAQDLAAILTGHDRVERGAPWWWSDRYDIHVEGVGRMSGPGSVVRRGDGVAFYVDDAQLVGAVSVNDSNSVRAARRIIDQRIPVTAHLLADLEHSLRALMREGNGGSS